MSAVDFDAFTEDDNPWWFVGQNARFKECAPHEASTGLGAGADTADQPSAKCFLCAAHNELTFRDGLFRCRDQLACSLRLLERNKR